MSNYKETTTSGTKWRRCNALTIRNTLAAEATPYVVFMEEDVISIGDSTIKTSVGTISKVFSPLEEITILNPTTGDPTGTTTTHEELYTILYSLYMQTALERDAQEV